MNAITRGLLVYLFLLVVFRISGKRTLSQATTFDLALLLIISETTQEAMIGNDHSLTHAMLLITVLVATDIVLSLAKRSWPRLDRWIDDIPLVILENGKPIAERLHKCRVDEGDILEAARLSQGLERLEQIKFAVLERNGEISIIPAKPAA